MSSKTQDESDVAVLEGDVEVEDPPRYAVILHNDDYSTMEFVIEVLEKFFHKEKQEAIQIMLKVHQQGKGVAGIFSLEIAETKVMQVTQYAQSNQFPLKCTIEPVEST